MTLLCMGMSYVVTVFRDLSGGLTRHLRRNYFGNGNIRLFSISYTHIAHPSIGTISGQSLGNDRRTDVGAVVQVANAYVPVAGLLSGQLA